MAEGRRPNGQPTCRVWPKASLLCGTQVTTVRIDGEGVYSFIRQGPSFFLLLFVMDPHKHTCAFRSTEKRICEFGSTYEHTYKCTYKRSYKFQTTYMFESTYKRLYMHFFPLGAYLCFDIEKEPIYLYMPFDCDANIREKFPPLTCLLMLLWCVLLL